MLRAFCAFVLVLFLTGCLEDPTADRLSQTAVS